MADTADDGVVRLASGDGGHIGDLARVGGSDVVNDDRVVANHLVGRFVIYPCHTQGKYVVNKMLCNWFVMNIIVR